MRTKANIKGHAIHQMLIPFPIGFLTGAFIFDLTGILYSDQFFRIGFYLNIAGIISAAAAAVPGFVDFLYSVPPKSTGKKRAVKHLSVNLSAVILFITALLIRQEPNFFSIPVLLAEAAGIILLTIGGWLGGTLVNRNFIGPDHRYANSGKWKEISFSEEQDEYEAAGADELKIDQMKLVRIKNKRIVLARTEEGYVSFDDSCSHRGGSLAGGVLICGTVQCLWHGSQFNTKTGQPVSGPAKEGIQVYRTAEKNGKIYIMPVSI